MKLNCTVKTMAQCQHFRLSSQKQLSLDSEGLLKSPDKKQQDSRKKFHPCQEDINDHLARISLSLFLNQLQHQLKEIGLEVKEQSIHLTTPQYLLNHTLQYKIYKDKTEAKWDKNKQILLLTLYCKKKTVLDELCGEEGK